MAGAGVAGAGVAGAGEAGAGDDGGVASLEAGGVAGVVVGAFEAGMKSQTASAMMTTTTKPTTTFLFMGQFLLNCFVSLLLSK